MPPAFNLSQDQTLQFIHCWRDQNINHYFRANYFSMARDVNAHTKWILLLSGLFKELKAEAFVGGREV
jgi:hypothetical protein